MLLTKQRTRRAEKELDSGFHQGRMTRSRLKDLTHNENDGSEKQNPKQSSGVFKDSGQVQLEMERQKFQEKVENEKSAREQRRQKRLMRNELPTSENKEEFKNIDWSSREILREFNRVKALRKKDKRSRRKRNRAKYYNRNRRGSINTEEETDLFENPEDFEWPDSEPIIQNKRQSTNSGRQVTKPENKDEEDENDAENLKIMMEANVYRLLGIQEQGCEEMKIF